MVRKPKRGKKSGSISRPWRYIFVLCLFAVANLGVLARVLYLQQFSGDMLLAEGKALYQRTETIPAKRGKILDRNGKLLAISAPVVDVYVDRARFDFSDKSYKTLAGALKLSVRSLEKKVQSSAKKGSVSVKLGLPPSQGQSLKALRIPGLSIVDRYERYYPFMEVAAHVTGYLERYGGGIEGIEKSFDGVMKGSEGRRVVWQDILGWRVDESDTAGSHDAKPGQDVVLSIDTRIQHLAYRALDRALKQHDAESGSVVVLDCKTGEVLAMVNLPAYNPNYRGDMFPGRVRNSALIDAYEPGSTIKPFVMAALLEGGHATPESVVDTSPGRRRIGNFVIGDIRNYGKLSLAAVIVKSSNVGISRFAERMPEKTLREVFSRIGLGQMPGTGFPGESMGRLPHFDKNTKVEFLAASYGYGFSSSLLQLAHAYTVFANDGWQPYLSLLKNEVGTGRREIFAPKVAHQVRAVLREVVSAGGTGSRAQLSGYSAAGKTGTVRVYGKGKYQEGEFNSTFAGFAPAVQARLSVAVMIREPSKEAYFGGEVAAPVFSEIAEQALRILGVPEDMPINDWEKWSRLEVVNAR